MMGLSCRSEPLWQRPFRGMYAQLLGIPRLVKINHQDDQDPTR